MTFESLSRLARFLDQVVHWFGFLKARLSEQSTWLLIGAGVASASALPAPWSYVSLAVAIIAAMIPNAKA